MKHPACHPERRFYARGLCRPCYNAKQWADLVAARKVVPMRGRRPAPLTIRLPTAESEIGYLAGIFDGEGNLSKTYRHAGGMGSWRVQIANTNKELIDWLMTIGGAVCIRDPHPGRHAKKRIYLWQLNGAANVRLFLKATVPLLKEKRAKALAAIAELDLYLQRHDMAA